MSRWHDRCLVGRRDGWFCAYCGTPLNPDNSHLEHVQPLSRGGADELWNCVIACPPCNLAKQTYWPDEWFNRCYREHRQPPRWLKSFITEEMEGYAFEFRRRYKDDFPVTMHKALERYIDAFSDHCDEEVKRRDTRPFRI